MCNVDSAWILFFFLIFKSTPRTAQPTPPSTWTLKNRYEKLSFPDFGGGRNLTNIAGPNTHNPVTEPGSILVFFDISTCILKKKNED